LEITVSGLCSYPVKSLASSPMPSLTFSSLGPHGDRRWMLTDATGKFVTQRQLPQMCRFLASAGTDEAATRLTLRDLSNDDEFQVDADGLDYSRTLQVRVWGDSVAAVDAGDAVADWMSARLGKALRLCYFPGSALRQVDLDYAERGDGVGFADGFPVLLCNTASLAVLQRALAKEAWEGDLSIWRFRPNIVVSGAGAFAEMAWRKLGIGDLELELVKPCSRCVIPTINPHSGEREAEVFRTLRKYCTGEDGQVYFGQNALVRARNGRTLEDIPLRNGMPVEVLD
jgi:uncharacterized protein